VGKAEAKAHQESKYAVDDSLPGSGWTKAGHTAIHILHFTRRRWPDAGARINPDLPVTNVMPEGAGITALVADTLHTEGKEQEVSLAVLKLDYVSCVLTIFSTILIGKRCWEGWVLAAINSVIVCVIGVRTEQLGFVPANLFCIVLCAWNLRSWRKEEPS
jgi:hypothetical protein